MWGHLQRILFLVRNKDSLWLTELEGFTLEDRDISLSHLPAWLKTAVGAVQK